jgi:hypothetical protein
VMVPDMKAGEMLVFKGSEVIHGSPVLVDPRRQGSRECVALAFYHL